MQCNVLCFSFAASYYYYDANRIDELRKYETKLVLEPAIYEISVVPLFQFH